MPGGRKKETYNHPYPPDFSKDRHPVPNVIWLKLMAQWKKIYYTDHSLRFWIVYVYEEPSSILQYNYHDQLYVVEVPKSDNTLELHCYNALGNLVYKWNDRTRFYMLRHQFKFLKKRINHTTSVEKKSFPGLLHLYGELYEGSNIKITPKPPPKPLRFGGVEV